MFPDWPAHQLRCFPGEINVRRLIVARQQRRKEKTVVARSATEFVVRRNDGGEDRMISTKQELERRRREEKWQIFWCCRDQRGPCRMVHASAEKLVLSGPAENERMTSVPQSEQLARTPEPLCEKGKEQSN